MDVEKQLTRRNPFYKPTIQLVLICFFVVVNIIFGVLYLYYGISNDVKGKPQLPSSLSPNLEKAEEVNGILLKTPSLIKAVWKLVDPSASGSAITILTQLISGFGFGSSVLDIADDSLSDVKKWDS